MKTFTQLLERWEAAVHYLTGTPSFSLFSDILKKFNPSLKGFSKGQGSIKQAFNLASPGAKASYVQIILFPPSQVKHF